MSEPRIIVSLDFPDAKQALNLLEQLDPLQCRVKIGKELFTASGPPLVQQIVTAGYDVFLDLKFHDIPNTVARACSAAAELGVWMMNVHASGGLKMMQAARDALNEHTGRRPLLVAVTVLTSMSDEDLKTIGISKPTAQQVLDLAQLTKISSLDGVVCSAQEAQVLKKMFGKDFLLVTPGIRPHGDAQDDQKRIMTPLRAIQTGSDYLVIGRPITQASNPREVLNVINKEISMVDSDS